METYEVRAWRKGIWSIVKVYAPQLLLWTLNHYFDNEGGLIHRYHWRYTQAMQVLPLIVMWHAFHIENAYALTEDWNDEWEYESDNDYRTEPYLYDFDYYGNGWNDYDSLMIDQFIEMQNFKSFAVAGVLAQYFIYKGIREEYFAACDRNALAELETHDAEEDEEPAAEFEEDAFF